MYYFPSKHYFGYNNKKYNVYNNKIRLCTHKHSKTDVEVSTLLPNMLESCSVCAC